MWNALYYAEKAPPSVWNVLPYAQYTLPSVWNVLPYAQSALATRASVRLLLRVRWR